MNFFTKDKKQIKYYVKLKWIEEGLDGDYFFYPNIMLVARNGVSVFSIC